MLSEVKIAIAENERVAWNADKHVDDIVDLDARRVHAVKAFLAEVTEVALYWVEAVAYEVITIRVISSAGDLRFLLFGGRTLVVAIDVTAEGLFVPGWEGFEVRSVFKELNDGLLDVCEGKEILDTHYLKQVFNN